MTNLPDKIRVLPGYDSYELPNTGERTELAALLKDIGYIPVLQAVCEEDRTPIDGLADEMNKQFSDFGGGLVGPYVLNRTINTVNGADKILPFSAPHGVALWTKARQ